MNVLKVRRDLSIQVFCSKIKNLNYKINKFLHNFLDTRQKQKKPRNLHLKRKYIGNHLKMNDF